MPFTMKVQPIDSQVPADRIKPVVKSRLKRLFERQFSGVLKNPPAEKIGGGDEVHPHNIVDFEPSSVCLAKMVQSFMEENHDKHSVSCARNCFNGNFDDSSDSELHALGGGGSSGEAYEILKGLVACPNVYERNLLADTTKIIEKNKTMCKRKDDNCRKIVTNELLTLGYDASICKSRWEKSTFSIAGEYEYIDVMVGKERVIIDIDFRSEFEVARSTKTYKAILQTLPYVFVGKSDRLQSIVAIASEAAKHSLKKKGLHVPPWRKLEYVRSKWFSSYTRITPPMFCPWSREISEETERKQRVLIGGGGGESELSCDESESKVVVEWKPPELKPKNSVQTGVKVVTGLAAVFRENP
ncbi:hypothetical protein TSUD_333530 [Trifolium subterraneum]|uniref:DUF506 domain-containing protein n=1 Tax=Trifolium subterraneum TaxID=3900 RepID=A0A2Z6NAH9_TRISU|nr:hypothetical protein TSUD_333530 [Trifolium subterraneum]